MPGTTPVYGFPYPEPTDLVADYPALGQQLAEDIEAVLPDLGGLAPVAPTSIANSGGSASTTANTTTFTGVNSVSLNSVFSATYDRYRIVILATKDSSIERIRMRLRVSGTDATTSYEYVANETSASAGNSAKSGATEDIGNVAATGSVISLDIYRPFDAATTLAVTHGAARLSGTTVWNWAGSWFHNTATSYSSFTIYPISGSMTGTVSVFGYKK